MIDRDLYAASAWDFTRLNEGLTHSRKVSDLDGVYHHDGHFLFLETKCSDRHDLSTGQRYELMQLAHKPGVTVLVLWSARHANGGRDPVDEIWIIRPTVAPIRILRGSDNGWPAVIHLRDLIVEHADMCDHPHHCAWSLRPLI